MSPHHFDYSPEKTKAERRERKKEKKREKQNQGKGVKLLANLVAERAKKIEEAEKKEKE